MEMPFQQALTAKSLIHDFTDHRSTILNTNLHPHIRGQGAGGSRVTRYVQYKLTNTTVYSLLQENANLELASSLILLVIGRACQHNSLVIVLRLHGSLSGPRVEKTSMHSWLQPQLASGQLTRVATALKCCI